jgi:hypothetical protein
LGAREGVAAGGRGRRLPRAHKQTSGKVWGEGGDWVKRAEWDGAEVLVKAHLHQRPVRGSAARDSAMMQSGWAKTCGRR